MAKKLGYRAAPTNVNKGYATHGSFVSSVKGQGQKPGKQGAIASKPAKEKLKNKSQFSFMKKVIGGMRAEGTKLRRINMMPNTGAYH